ncbi:uncharacterized protein LOC124938731 [Impatiens glandulifera]|uniref:uncharacterized protein LOC124938731 n=1 Tax=Impatiens glandulifera TaxID=253017 RepID=UPI001FB1328E|nr:uncharacterized protein LOC124938731 [Impatiens glandulifera]
MYSPFIDACNCKTIPTSHYHKLLGFRTHHSLLSSPSSTTVFSTQKLYPLFSCNFNGGDRNRNAKGRDRVNAKGKDNVWSVDNDIANSENGNVVQRRRGKRGKKVRKRSKSDKVMVSGAMLIEVETVLQTQEPVILPVWKTFASSVSGIWKGVGAVFSPMTAEMEPIAIGSKHDNLYDCYTLSRIQAVPLSSEVVESQIKREVNWVTLNPNGESKGKSIGVSLPKFESFDFKASDLMEEDVMAMGSEPGLVFFEDGSFSRGPMDIPVGEAAESTYYLNPTFKFEQCLVKGCHKRMRIVHTIEFSNGGSDIQIMRVAVYEEQWVSPVNIPDESDVELDMKPFSERKRIQPSHLTGQWKVFEMSATPIYDEEDVILGDSSNTPYVYLCTETLKKRNLPENLIYFGEEEFQDMQDATILWLPGGITGYVDVNKDGTLCVGVGWYSDEGINLVMERDYGTDGKLKEVRSKSEVKRRWSDSLPS